MVNIIDIKALGTSSEQASQLLQRVGQRIIDLHTASYLSAVNERSALIEKLKKQFNEIEKYMNLMESQVMEIRQRDPVQASILSIEAGQLLPVKLTILQQIANLEGSLSDIQTRPTAILREPTLPISPKKPRPFLYIILAVAAGIVIGIFIALIAEFFTKFKTKDSR